MSVDELHGIYILENGKSLCTQCSVAFSNIGNGKRHFNQVHLGVKGSTGPKPGPDGTGAIPGPPPPQPSDWLAQQQPVKTGMATNSFFF